MSIYFFFFCIISVCICRKNKKKINCKIIRKITFALFLLQKVKLQLDIRYFICMIIIFIIIFYDYYNYTIGHILFYSQFV